MVYTIPFYGIVVVVVVIVEVITMENSIAVNEEVI